MKKTMFRYTKEGVNEYGSKVKKPLVGKIVTHSIIGLILVIVFLSSWTIIRAGERGVVLRLGELNRIIEPGFNFKMPLVDKVVKFEVRTTKQETEASAASNDLQIVTSNVAVQYNLIPENVGLLYEEVGGKYRSRVIDPAIQDAIKAITARFSAEELITKRKVVSDEMETLLATRLLEAHINVSNVDIVNFDFSESFNSAIEAKVTAEQKALEAENKLKQVEFEAKQKIETAKAEAESIRIKANAITQQGGKDFVQLQAIEKWDGVLPTQFVPGSTIPFINLVK